MMHPLTKLASKLYPRWWRERYGEEFAALLEDARPGLGGTLDVLKGALTMQASTPSLWKPILVCAAAGSIAALASTFFMTPRYASSAVVKMMAPAGSQADVVGTINGYSRTVMSRAELSIMMRELKLYPDERRKMPVEDVLEIMKRNILISAAPAIVGGHDVPAFQLSFQHPDRDVAQKVVTNLVSKFLDANLQAGIQGQRAITLEVLDPASRPMDPVFPNRKTVAVAGLGSGALIGGIAALFRYLRRKRQAA